jgi:tRNA A-37 threonylcarbamoyl transferase component Bud32
METLGGSESQRVRRRRSWTRRLVHVDNLDEDIVERLWHDPADLIRAAQVIQRGNRSVVGRLDAGGQSLLVKEYVPQGVVHALTHLFLPTRARWSWRMAWRMREAGVHTPRPLAIVEDDWGPLNRRAMLVTAFIEGRELHEVATDATTGRGQLDVLANQLREIWQRLGAARITNDDIKANNFMIDGGNRLWLVDLDGARQWPKGWLFEGIYRHKRRSDRRSFLNRWVDYPEAQAFFAPCLDSS